MLTCWPRMNAECGSVTVAVARFLGLFVSGLMFPEPVLVIGSA